MSRHRTDLFALLFGIAFAFAGLAVLAVQFTDTTPGPRWMIAAGLILLGTVTLIATVANGVRSTRETNAIAIGSASVDASVVDSPPDETPTGNSDE